MRDKAADNFYFIRGNSKSGFTRIELKDGLLGQKSEILRYSFHLVSSLRLLLKLFNTLLMEELKSGLNVHAKIRKCLI